MYCADAQNKVKAFCALASISKKPPPVAASAVAPKPRPKGKPAKTATTVASPSAQGVQKKVKPAKGVGKRVVTAPP
eukprot:6708324-Prymnesium_polylepis.1